MDYWKLFVYGTLNNPAKQQELFGRVIGGTADALSGYATETIVDGGAAYHAAVRHDGAEIQGRVLEVTTADLASADAWEGDSYNREQLRLKSGVIAWVYLKK
jgi:gamma-glutamylcyclotransferase (GGCT)/AIG2-like uncharacterized protein YtfP